MFIHFANFIILIFFWKQKKKKNDTLFIRFLLKTVFRV